MKSVFVALLIFTNLATAYQMFVYQQRYEMAISNKTTDYEREAYGKGCVDWLNEQSKERGINLTLARSWKKHGQLVFEITPDQDLEWKEVIAKLPEAELPSFLCTYDKQSGVMYAITGPDREKWMFYE